MTGVADARRAGRRPSPGARVAIRNVAGLVIFIGIAQAVSMWGPRQWQVPSFGDFISKVVDLITLPPFVQAVLDTLLSVIVSVAIATALAIVIGVLFGSSRFLAIGFGLPFEIVRPIPAFAIIPLAILALGQGQQMEIAVAAFASCWTLLFNTIYGVRQVDRQAIDAARSMGLGPLPIAARIVVPSVLPFVIAGLRTAMPISLIVVIGAEYISTGGRGIGGILVIATSGGDLSVLWATAAIAGVLGILLGAIVALAGRLLCPWADERAK